MGPIVEGIGEAVERDGGLALFVAFFGLVALALVLMAVVGIVERLTGPARQRAKARATDAEARLREADVRLVRAKAERVAAVAYERSAAADPPPAALPSRADGEPVSLDKP